MTRRGYYWLLVLVVPAPAWALSPALTNALGQLANAQVVASLVLLAIVTIWVPKFIRQKVLEREFGERVADLDREIEFRGLGQPVMAAAMSDGQFYETAKNAGWQTSYGTAEADEPGPNPAGYEFADEFQNSIEGLRVSAPNAPGAELGWGPEEFEDEESRREELAQKLHISEISESALDEAEEGSYSLLPEPTWEDEPDPMDEPERLPSNHYSYAIT